MISTGSYLDKRDNEYDEIQEYFDLYLQATRMLAGSYAVIGDTENAQRVFDMSVDKIKGIDYSKLKTIEYAHQGADFNRIYENADEYLRLFAWKKPKSMTPYQSRLVGIIYWR